MPDEMMRGLVGSMRQFDPGPFQTASEVIRAQLMWVEEVRLRRSLSPRSGRPGDW